MCNRALCDRINKNKFFYSTVCYKIITKPVSIKINDTRGIFMTKYIAIIIFFSNSCAVTWFICFKIQNWFGLSTTNFTYKRNSSISKLLRKNKHFRSTIKIKVLYKIYHKENLL